MKKIVKIAVFILLAALAVSAVTGCGDNNGKDTETEMTTEKPTEKITETEQATEEPAPAGPTLRAVYPGTGEVVSLLTDEMTAWLAKYKPAKLDKIWDFTEKCEPVPLLLSWEDDGGALYSHVLVADNAGMENAETYLVAGNSLLLEDLYSGQKYYWQIISEREDKTVRSAVFGFETLYAPRTVAVDGVSNIRDMGGYLTEGGRRMKRGIVYRGADLTRVTEAGIDKMVRVYGIKTELDLRERTNRGPSPLGKDINYVAVSAPWYNWTFDETYKEDLVKELRVFADAENYPIFFHCSLGRDRTGTLAFLLEALCGMSVEDINKDYEVSFFSDTGGYNDNNAPSAVMNSFIALRQSVQKYAKKESLSNAARAFLLSVGMTDAELDAIVANLTEDVR